MKTAGYGAMDTNTWERVIDAFAAAMDVTWPDEKEPAMDPLDPPNRPNVQGETTNSTSPQSLRSKLAGEIAVNGEPMTPPKPADASDEAEVEKWAAYAHDMLRLFSTDTYESLNDEWKEKHRNLVRAVLAEIRKPVDLAGAIDASDKAFRAADPNAIPVREMTPAWQGLHAKGIRAALEYAGCRIAEPEPEPEPFDPTRLLSVAADDHLIPHAETRELLREAAAEIERMRGKK